MKRLFYLITLLAMAIIAKADKLIVENLSVTPGETANLVIKYQFDKPNLYAGYQFELKLPKGVSTIRNESGVSDFKVGSCHDTSFMVSNNYNRENDVVTFIGFSLMANTLTGSDGVLMTIPVKIDESLLAGSTLIGNLQEVQLGNLDGVTTEYLEDEVFEIQVNIASSIPSIETNKANISKSTYLLDGRKVNVGIGQIYIQNGKKYIKK